MDADPATGIADEELLRRVAAGDEEAFSVLFRRHRGTIYRFALHMTGGAGAIAEDVTQEAFLAVMRDAGRYVLDRGTVVAWLCGVARNQVRRRLARDRFLVPLDSEVDRVATPLAPAPHDVLAGLVQDERLNRLRRAVASLPLRYREVVVLCELEELSYADAASALGCAIGTVRSRLHRARSLLTTKLAAEHGSTAERAAIERAEKETGTGYAV